MLICNCAHCFSTKICTWNPSAHELGFFLLSLYSFHTHHFPFDECKVVLEQHHQKCTKRASCHSLVWGAGWTRVFFPTEMWTNGQITCKHHLTLIKVNGDQASFGWQLAGCCFNKKVCLGRKTLTTNTKIPWIFFTCYPSLCFSKNHLKKFLLKYNIWSVSLPHFFLFFFCLFQPTEIKMSFS